jgi:hypothetical protein
MSVPAELTGAWRRAGLIVDGVRSIDACEVLWLQSPDWYADIRLPRNDVVVDPAAPAAAFAAAWAFGGTADWDPPVMTWHHRFDLRRDGAPDANPLVRERGLMVERGAIDWAGRQVPFEEEWSRLSDDRPETTVDIGVGRMVISVDRWRISIADGRPHHPFTAVRQDYRAGRWQTTGSIHEPDQPAVAARVHDGRS